MEARDRALPEWFNRIRTGQVRLPRFQRFEAWNHDRVAGLLQTVLRGLPAGAALVLEVGDQELFKSRPMVGAPEPTERATEHLLDGQQRLTALWRSFHDNFQDRTYFLQFEPDEQAPEALVPTVYGQPRWERDSRRYPVWADEPPQIFRKGYIPLRLLRPGDISKEITDWCKKAIGTDADKILALKDTITALKERVTTFNLPFLSLPVGTSKSTATTVFIEMNTSAAQLTAFDIVVAQVEEETGTSLHELVSGIKKRAGTIESYITPANLVLSAGALRANRAPTQASFLQMDLRRLVSEWDKLVGGIAFAINFLEEERLFDGDRLPTLMVLPVISAASEFVPPSLDALGRAKTVLRKYMWRSFATGRYENNAATRALQDYRMLSCLLKDGAEEFRETVFDDDEYPLPTVDQIKRAGWPRKRDILARAILAVSIRAGAQDLADGTPASRTHLLNREYHHIFPDALLTKEGGIDEVDSSRALNCILITWHTNRNIAAKEPLRYLRERINGATLGEEEIRARLRSHVVPFDLMNVGGYPDIKGSDKRADRINYDYTRFINKRAELILQGMEALCSGRNWTGNPPEAAVASA